MTSLGNIQYLGDRAPCLVVLFFPPAGREGWSPAFSSLLEPSQAFQALPGASWSSNRLRLLSSLGSALPRASRSLKNTVLSLFHDGKFKTIHGRMRKFHEESTLGTTLPCLVDDLSAYPHEPTIGVYMGKQLKSLNLFSPSRHPQKSRYRRNTSIFPSIPNPYYDD